MKRSTLAFIFCLMTFSKTGSSQTSQSKSNFYLEHYELPTKVCILFENDSFIVMTSTLDLKIYYEAEDSISRALPEYCLFLDCYSENDTFNFYSCAESRHLDDLVLYRAAELIVESKCVILNKQTNKPVYEIQTQPYDRVDVAGISYTVGDVLLFETITRIY